MQPDKIAFAREWYAKGVCPGCRAPLEKVAGIGHRHYLGGLELRVNNPWKDHRERVPDKSRNLVYSEAGDPAGAAPNPDDPALCPWDADTLTSLVLIGSGMVYGGGRGVLNTALPRDTAPPVRDRPAPVIAPAIVSGRGNK